MATYKANEIAAARKAAASLNNAEMNLEASNNILSQIFEIMKSNGWKGNTSTTFYSNAEDYKKQLSELDSQIKEVESAMNTIINKAEELSNEIEKGA